MFKHSIKFNLIDEYKLKRREINSLHSRFDKNNLELVTEAKSNFEGLEEAMELR
jgi:hypothetical protein